jgi:alkylhydroperoxidase family enzyme
MRLNYVSTPFQPANDEESTIHANILARRGPAGLIPLDLTYLHAPLLADGFNSFMKAVRTRNSLEPSIRELAFCRVAAVLGCWYEWDIHKSIALESGLSEEALNFVRKRTLVTSDLGRGSLDAIHLAVLDYADSMTLNIRVAEDVWKAVRQQFSEKHLVELTSSIAAFNSVCRFVTALDVSERNDG